MNEELQELYQAVILDHNKHPKNFSVLEGDDIESAEGFNPLCGDHYHFYFKKDESGNINDISFQGQGCAISKASASMMTQALKGKKVEEIQELTDLFTQLLMRKIDPNEYEDQLGKLIIFSNIWKYPARVKCASLAWHTIKNFLNGNNSSTKTE